MSTTWSPWLSPIKHHSFQSAKTISCSFPSLEPEMLWKGRIIFQITCPHWSLYRKVSKYKCWSSFQYLFICVQCVPQLEFIYRLLSWMCDWWDLFTEAAVNNIVWHWNMQNALLEQNLLPFFFFKLVSRNVSWCDRLRLHLIDPFGTTPSGTFRQVRPGEIWLKQICLGIG